MPIYWTNILLGLIAAVNIGAVIKIVSVIHSFHQKEIQAIRAAQEIGEKERNLLQKQLDIQKENFEQRISQKDEIIGHYQNMLKAELRDRISDAGIVVDVTNPQPAQLDDDAVDRIKEIIDRVERLEKDQILPDAETSLYLFEFYYARQEYILAAKMLERAIYLGDASSDNYFNLGVSYNNGGDFSRALKAYEKAVELEPRKAIYWSYYGSVLKKLGRLTEAEVNLTRAIELDPNCDDAHYNLAAVYAMQGKIDDCIRHLKKAVQIDPFWKTYAFKRPYFEKVRNNPNFLTILN